MLTLPAEITNNKNKISVSPILIVEFVDLDYHVATKEYYLSRDSGSDGQVASDDEFSAASATFQTDNIKAGDRIEIDGNTEVVESVTDEQNLVIVDTVANGSIYDWEIWSKCEDFIKSGSNIKINHKINERMSGVAALTGSMKLHLLDFVGTLRSELIGSSPDLADSTVYIYIKLDTVTDLDTNALKIMEGIISDYSIRNDVLSITIKTKIKNFGLIPTDPLIDNYDKYFGDKDICKPLQYGDFNWNLYPYLWVLFDKGLAYCPYVRSYYHSGDPIYYFWVADHNMENMPNATQLQSTHDFYAFLYRDGKYCGIEMLNTNSKLAITNTGGECYIRTDGDGGHVEDIWDICEITEEYAPSGSYDNDIGGWDECVDGNSGTDASLALGENLSVQTVDLDHVNDNYLDSGVDIRLVVTFGAISHTGATYVRIFDKATETAQATTTINPSTGAANTTQIVTVTGIGSTFDINDYFFNVGVQNAGSGSVTVQNMTLMFSCPAHDLEQEPYILLRCQGREYSGTWGSRKTTGNLIDNPADIIESIFRDELNITDLDTSEFDTVHSAMDTIGVEGAGTILKQDYAEDVLRKICEGFNISLIKKLSGDYKIFFPKASINNFSSSGTGTPGNEDIFTDDETLSSGSYAQHPIRKGTFQLSRSKSQNVYERFTIDYRFINDLNEYMESYDPNSGNPNIFKSWMMQEVDSVVAFHSAMNNWNLDQKFICQFETFINAIAHEVGDIINIRHTMLNDDMLNATINTQKWAVLQIQSTWKPNIYKFTAIELL